jgi:hypothetical protein
MFFLMASILVADFYLAIYFQAVHDDSPLMSGVHMLPTTLGIVLFTMLSGTLSEPNPASWITPEEDLLTDMTTCSRGSRLLSPLDGRRRRSISHWLRPLVPSQPFDLGPELDRLPGLVWRWRWMYGFRGESIPHCPSLNHS